MRREIGCVVAPEDDGRLVKRVVRARLGVSHRQFTSLKQKNAVLLDGAPVHADVTVRAGQRVSVLLDEDETGGAPASDGPVNVVYEDEDILVVDKEAPLACMSGLDQPGDSLEGRLTGRYGAGYVFRPVNRLDKGTSGLMAVAKHAHAQQLMQRALHTDAYVREYAALVEGRVEPAAGVIDAPIGKADGATVRREVRPDGKSAVTRYETVASGGGYTLLRVRLETGRTHQIRVHLASRGWPITGDFLYGREDARLPGRFALHSAKLALAHPVTGERMTFESAPPIVFYEMMGSGSI
ncbi:MAG: RluA family pseudouridine synthase [Clostridia bacterium]|nr:RluA family pseudouridine synthase [Clostridia bacterium]